MKKVLGVLFYPLLIVLAHFAVAIHWIVTRFDPSTEERARRVKDYEEAMQTYWLYGGERPKQPYLGFLQPPIDIGGDNLESSEHVVKFASEC